MRFHRSPSRLLPALAVLALAACNEEPDFGFGDWEVAYDTVTLYSADRPDLQGLPAAYDILATRTLRIEDSGATGNWDFVLTGGVEGPLTLTPLGAFFDVGNNAGLATLPGEDFETLESAPSGNAAYVTDASIPLATGNVYVVRSRQSGNCMSFAKLEPLEIDQAEGTLTFQLSANPNCNDTDLVPPED
jgi:hypothetical protein